MHHRITALTVAAMGVLAACGSSGYSTPSSASSPTSGGANAATTVSAAGVPGLGTVMVNGNGMTIYVLSSEKGGKITCTDDNGCTKVWPDTELPKGTTQGIPGRGAQASLLGTVKTADGSLYLTYGGWPLYTYTGDRGPMESHGEGINSFGGTWTALSPAGSPVTSGSPVGGPAAGGSSTGGGAGYSGGGY